MFPWGSVKPGQGFFVPCLDTARVRLQGLQQAARLGIRAQARVAIRKGRYGVWFSVPAAEPRDPA